ncbi:glycosyltransferase family 2 protein [Pedobacter frigoris]|uniref:Glycosyltransferase n=1 Tax=Pedobacter frigoris TaxID=2571272 RepID=A0A4U1CAP6_9SPHI|nr:glycosyltransferase family 2 protein [Pedobacter frigoris]TKC02915.1 glycosyltransferase [Pedobacter frigoris]
MQSPSISLVISTYNWPEALLVSLKSVLAQSVLPVEILIADDGSGPATKAVIDDFKLMTTIPVTHFWQEDDGFRKTIVMNRAINAANGEHIIQIDGDIVLHPKFIADHRSEAMQGHYIKGSRSMLSAERTQTILKTQNPKINVFSSGVGSKINATRSPLFAPLFRGDQLKSNNLRGCNFSFWKQDFVDVNGYNNDLQGWGHEDIELAARLTNLGIKQRQLKMKAICFHLYHKINSRHNEDLNYKKYLAVIKDGTIKCKNGIKQL